MASHLLSILFKSNPIGMKIDNSSNSKAFYSFPIDFYVLETPIEAPIGLAGMLHYFIYRCYVCCYELFLKNYK